MLGRQAGQRWPAGPRRRFDRQHRRLAARRRQRCDRYSAGDRRRVGRHLGRFCQRREDRARLREWQRAENGRRLGNRGEPSRRQRGQQEANTEPDRSRPERGSPQAREQSDRSHNDVEKER